MITKDDESFKIQKTNRIEPKTLLEQNLLMNVALISELVNIVTLVKYELFNAIVNKVIGNSSYANNLTSVIFRLIETCFLKLLSLLDLLWLTLNF